MNMSYIPGQSTAIALVIAGVHGSELSGIEVARWLDIKLKSNWNDGQNPPYMTTCIVPEVFPASAVLARQCRDLPKSVPDHLCELTQHGRELYFLKKRLGAVTAFVIYPNRSFPPPGQSFQYLRDRKGPTDAGGNAIKLLGKQWDSTRGRWLDADKGKAENWISAPLIAEIGELAQLIELLKPTHIVSIHGKKAPPTTKVPPKGAESPGIYVDPTYDYDAKACAVDPWGGASTFATDLCKFDVTIDPAFPLVGRAVEINDALKKGGMSISNSGKTAVKDLLKQAKANWISWVDAVGKGSDAQNDADQAMKLLQDAATYVGITFKGKKETLSARKSSEDDQLDLELAQELWKKFPALVPGNHLGGNDKPPTVHYPASTGHPQGFSLGDWGPVAVNRSNGPGQRPAAPVITVEVFGYDESFSFDGDRQVYDEKGIRLRASGGKGPVKGRSEQLQAYADVLRTRFLGQR